jgi:glycosyltransferase involved in cell wall biosynthesis
MRKKILFIKCLESPFVENDLILLKNHFNVKVVNFTLRKMAPLKSLVSLVKVFIGILWSDITFSWFATKHAYYSLLISKALGKKSVVVVGGYEVAKEPKFNYGLLINSISAFEVKYVINNATKILFVDKGLKIDAEKNLNIKINNFEVIPTGYNYQEFKPEGIKENLILTVAVGNDWNRVKIKGIDVFIDSAKYLPDKRFMIIGLNKQITTRLKSFAPLNVEFKEALNKNELIKYYQKAKVYCQLSLREGLPNAICEAMLCECVPVGAYVQGVTTAIGKTGFYVPYGDSEATAAAIKKALKSNKGKEARDRVKRLFPIEKREKKLINIIDGLIKK